MIVSKNEHFINTKLAYKLRHVNEPALLQRDWTGYFHTKISTFLTWLHQQLQVQLIDGISLATMAHYFLVVLHPFHDGNGRCARLLMNWVLMKCDYPPVIIPSQNKDGYLESLRLADQGDIRPLIRFVSKCLVDTVDKIENF
uniref:Fido domain-containing protein n=1 Tax=Ditylenchus dipsaci TaxID=166011 RepID=A0A915DT90_9BILA